MAKLLLKAVRYIKCYSELTFGDRPDTLEGTIDYCVDRPIIMGQVRSEILELAKILQKSPPRRSLEIGTNYGGTLFLLCALSTSDARIISVDLPAGPFGGGYPRRKAVLFRKFVRGDQELHLIRADSHLAGTKYRVMRALQGDKLDYLFVDGDHTYDGVRKDFEMYSPLVRSGGMVAFHDIVEHRRELACEVDKYWNHIKQRYQHHELIEDPKQGWAGIGVIFMS
jgi:predicted O-methyltransferase YrrM